MNADGTGVRVLLEGTGYHMYNLAWSPDGERLAFGGGYRDSEGVFVVGADGSGLTLVDPRWGVIRIGHRTAPASRTASRLASALADCLPCGFGTLEIAALDGTHVQGSATPSPGRGTRSSSRSRSSDLEGSRNPVGGPTVKS